MTTPLAGSSAPPCPATDWFRRGMELLQARQPLDAARCLRQAIQLQPDYLEAIYNLGLLFQHLGQPEQALACYQRVLASQPDFAPAWNNQGVALKDTGRLSEALASYHQALHCNPNAADSWNNLGNLLRALGRYSEAIDSFHRALQLDSANHLTWHNLGNALRELGRLWESAVTFRRVLDQRPDFAEAHWDLAFSLLLAGEWTAGWEEYEWRWRRADYPRRTFTQPEWHGEDLTDKTILVYSEQGLGDTIQFIRYASLLAKRARRVLVECQSSLASLLQTVSGVHQIIPRGQPLPAFDVQVPLLSLPRRFQTTLTSIPESGPYLTVETLGRIGPQLPPAPAATRWKVGLVWAGNPRHHNDRQRSIPFRLLQPLFRLPEMAFYSLQVGAAAAAAAFADEPFPDLNPLIHDFADTAALVKQLDLVITVDTAVAHLAGALGQRAWLLLPFAPDWRWLLNREESPWYPSMRLYRQNQPGDWTGVIARVEQDLARACKQQQFFAKVGVHSADNTREPAVGSR